MGTKFANINVKCSDIDSVRALFPDHTVKTIAQGWVTVVSGALQWGNAQGPAKKASRALPCPVLSTEYFDDDYVEFSVYLAGKRAARFVPAGYEDFCRVPGKPSAWQKALGISDGDVKSLRAVFREEDPETCVRLMESLLGCPIWADEECIDLVQAPDRSYLESYLARKEAESRIVNRTNLKLLDQLPCSFAVTGGNSVLAWHDDDTAALYQLAGGSLQKLFHVPPHISGQLPVVYPPEGEADKLFPLRVQRPDGEAVYTLDRDGKIVDEFLSPGTIQEQCLALDSERILKGGVCRNVRTGETLWDMGIRNSGYSGLAPLTLPDGRLCWGCDTVDRHSAPVIWDSYLLSAAPDGTDRRRVKLPGVYHWQMPVLWGDRLLLGCEETLTCYDSHLDELWSVNLDRNVFQGGVSAVDGDTLYMFSYDRLTVMDLTERRVTAERRIGSDENIWMAGVLPGVGPVVTNLGSELQVWDRELRPVSRHRMRGEFRLLLRSDGRCCVLTFSQGGARPGLRLYELRPRNIRVG